MDWHFDDVYTDFSSGGLSTDGKGGATALTSHTYTHGKLDFKENKNSNNEKNRKCKKKKVMINKKKKEKKRKRRKKK